MLELIGSLLGGVFCSSHFLQDGISANQRDIAHALSDSFPKNHDAPRAVLRAAATALEKLARSETRNINAASDLIERQAAEAFEDRLTNWTSQWRKATDEELDGETIQAILKGVNATLTAGTSGSAGAAELAIRRAEAVAAVRHALIEAINPPLPFLERFDGNGDDRGFFAAFAEYVAVELKKDASFESIFQAELLIEIRAALTDVLSEARSFERRRKADALRDSGVEWIDDILTTAGIPNERPSAMVLAKYRLMRFADFDGRLRDLLEWTASGAKHATEAKRSVLGRLYVGDGGAGKTRLSIELAEELDERGWEVARVSTLSDSAQIWRTLEGRTAPNGILVIIDYVEAKRDALKSLSFEAERLAKIKGPDLRILVLSRSAESWWDAALSENGMGVFERQALSIGQARTGLDLTQRQRLFNHAVDVFRMRLKRFGLAGASNNRPDLSSDTYQRPLSLAFAAYLSARGETATSGINLISDMLKEEERGWRRYLKSIGAESDETRLALLRRGTAQMTFLQGAASDVARHALQQDAYFGAQPLSQIDRTLSDLQRFYPSDTNTGDTVSALEPDILGERQIADVSTSADGSGLLIQSVVAASQFDSFPTKAGLIFQVLVRGASQHPELAIRDNFHQLIDHCTTSIKSGVFLPPAISSMSAALPEITTVLRSMAVAIETKHLESDMGDISLPRRASILNNLGVRHYASGDREAAMKATQEAVDIYRTLAAKNPDAFNSGLASSLSVLGDCFAAFGKHDEATQEAVDIYRTLAAKNPDAFNPVLAMGLNNLGADHHASGDHEAAMKATQEAVNIRRTLVAKNPDAFNPDLASSLSVLGDCFSASGKYDEAVSCYLEAGGVLKPYLKAAPKRFGLLWEVNCIDLVKVCIESGKTENAAKAHLLDLGLTDKQSDSVVAAATAKPYKDYEG